MALRTLDGSLGVAIISLLGEGADHEPDPEGTFLLPPVGDIIIALQHTLVGAGFRSSDDAEEASDRGLLVVRGLINSYRPTGAI